MLILSLAWYRRVRSLRIIARNRSDIAPPYGYITAPATQADEKFGLFIINSKLSKEAGVPAKSFALGRPWHPTTQFSDGRYADPNAIGLAAFINCDIDDHIYGWDKMSGKDKAGEKIWFYPEDSRFYESANRGPGGREVKNTSLALPMPRNILSPPSSPIGIKDCWSKRQCPRLRGH